MLTLPSDYVQAPGVEAEKTVGERGVKAPSGPLACPPTRSFPPQALTPSPGFMNQDLSGVLHPEAEEIGWH